MKPLTVDSALTSTATFLADKGVESARLEAELLLGFVLKMERLQLYLQYDRPLAPDEINAFKDVIKKRLSGRPLAYITGHKSFLKWDFSVNPMVLIPRPETELLVEKTVEVVTQARISGIIEKATQTRLLELGTGSGIIAISLALYLPEVYIDAVDISPQAVAVAEENAKRLGVKERISFFTGDLYKPIPETYKGSYLGIVSNPPYIPTKVIPTLSREVQAEPVTALDGGESGLDFYKSILESAGKYLSPAGFLIFEHGHDQYPSLNELAKNAGYNNTVNYKDLSGYTRVLLCSK